MARREYATADLRRRLLACGHEAEVVAGVLDTLSDEGLLSDGRFAESFVRSRVDKGYGPTRIRSELCERGIDDSLAEACLGPYQSEWLARLAAVRHKRFGAPLPTERRDRARQARYLQHRGFTPEQTWTLLDDRIND